MPKLIKIELTREQTSLLKNVFEDAKRNTITTYDFEAHQKYCNLYQEITLQLAAQHNFDSLFIDREIS